MKKVAELFLPQSSHVYGVTTGTVTNNQDPENLGRVKVRFSSLSENYESHWARIATLMAGSGRGVYWLPEVNDEVLVAFEQGDMERPYILGGLWNGEDKPPDHDQENNQRLLKTRKGHTIVLDDTADTAQVSITSSSGHSIVFDDTNGKEKLSMTSQGGHQILIDDQAATISIGSADGKNTLTIDIQNNAMTIATQGKLTLRGQNIELAAKAGVNITAKQNVDIQGVAVNVK
jgi:phage baseplate assembly protein V